MDLEQALRNHWANSVALSSLVPVDRVFTGAAQPEAQLPCVSLNVNREDTVVQTSHNLVYRIRVIWEIAAKTFEQARSVGQIIRTEYHQQTFSTGSEEALWLRFLECQDERTEDWFWKERLIFSGLAVFSAST